MASNTENYEFHWNQIESGAPEKEPARQYYFMETAKGLLKAKFEQDCASGEALEQYGEEKLEEMKREGSVSYTHLEEAGEKAGRGV